ITRWWRRACRQCLKCVHAVKMVPSWPCSTGNCRYTPCSSTRSPSSVQAGMPASACCTTCCRRCGTISAWTSSTAVAQQRGKAWCVLSVDDSTVRRRVALAEQLRHIVAVEAVVLVAELAVDLDAALFLQQVFQVFGTEGDQRAFDLVARAGAGEVQVQRFVETQVLFVEEAVQQLLRFQLQYFLRLQGVGQDVDVSPVVFALVGTARRGGQRLQEEARGALRR